MLGLGQQVGAVEIRIRAGLLDNENCDAQRQQVIEDCRVEVAAAATAQRNRHIAPYVATRTRSVTAVGLD